MTTRSDTQALIDELYNAAELYYQKSEDSPLTDEEFDAKLDLLEELSQNPENADLFTPDSKGWGLLENDVSLGTKVAADAEEVEHRTPMLSLGKAKNEATLQAFVTKARANGAQDFRLQAKLDGFALSATYENGRLARIATRGTGTHGEDITYIATAADVTIVGLPTLIADTSDLEVRGELFFTEKQFKAVDNRRYALTGERFKNPRNSVVGLMKKAKIGVSYPVEFTLSTYSALRDNTPIDLSDISDQGFTTVDQVTLEQVPTLKLTGYTDDNDLFKAVEKFGEARKSFTIPTDGVVVKPTNEAEMLTKMGNTSHHPSSQIAYKYPGETADTEVLDIVVTVGKTGKLTPAARVRPVLVDGSLIENCTLSNYNWVYAKDVRVGSLVRINKANDIIPEIKVVLSNPEGTSPVTVPTECPVCDTTLVFDKTEDVWPPKTLKCPNDTCPSRDFFALKTAVGKAFLDIDGLSEATLTALNDAGRVTNIGDLYTLTLDELANSSMGESKNGNPRRLGEKRAQNILDHIEKSKTLPLPRLLKSLNIEHLGNTTSKALVKHFKTIENILAATPEEMSTLEGFGEVMSQKLSEGFSKRAALIATLQSHGVVFSTPTDTADTADTAALSGVSFAISGAVPQPFANRTAWVDYIEANGGEFHSSPKAETTWFVGDPEDTSTKVKKAKALGINFISPEDFTSTWVN